MYLTTLRPIARQNVIGAFRTICSIVLRLEQNDLSRGHNLRSCLGHQSLEVSGRVVCRLDNLVIKAHIYRW